MRNDADRARAREMFRKMSPKEKIGHIFRYYWPHMAAAAVLLVLALTFVQDYRDAAQTRSWLYVGLQEGYYEELQPAVQQLADEGGWDEELNWASVASAESEDGMGLMQLMLYVSSDELDLVVCDEATAALLGEDESIPCRVWPVADTALAGRVGAGQELYVVLLEETGRADRVSAFADLLLPGGAS